MDCIAVNAVVPPVANLGYLFKNLASDEVFRLQDGGARGEPALSPALVRKLLGEFARTATA